jgi:hypothetical protein
MKGRSLVLIATVMYVVAWMLPVESNLPTLRQGVLPGWAAFRLSLWPYDTGSGPWYTLAHYVASSLSNFVFLGALVATRAGRKRASGALLVILLACAALNTHWFVINGDRQDLRIGYYLWAGSFFLLSAGLALERRAIERRTRS